MSHQSKSGKRKMNQLMPQSGAMDRHAVDIHYSDACGCRNCRRLRAKRDRKAVAS